MISGVALLMAASVAVKIIGMIFKIPIQRLIGDEGMGYFNVAYNIYAWFYILSTSGLPSAVSVLVARANAKGQTLRCERILFCAVLSFTAAGALLSGAMMLSSGALSGASGLYGARYAVLCIAPTLMFSAVSSAVRGYYQGLGIMWPTAVSQLIEALCKLILGLLFAVFSVRRGDPVYVSAALAILGISIGALLSGVFSVLTKCLYKPLCAGTDSHVGRVMPDIIRIALPITVSSSVMNLTSLIDVFLCPILLCGIGFTTSQAAEIFGNYTTLAVSLFNLPGVFIYPIAYAVSPLIASLSEKGKSRELNENVKTAFRVSAMISLPCGAGLGVLSYPILELIFTPDSASLAAPMLSMLSVSVLFSALLAVSNTVLQSTGHQNIPIISMLIGALAKLIVTFAVFRYTELGRFGIPIGTNAFYILSSLVNLLYLAVSSKGRINPITAFIRPAVASAVCALTARYVYSVSADLGKTISLFAAIFAASAVYFAVIVLIGGLTVKDLELLLGKERLSNIKNRFGKKARGTTVQKGN